MEAVLEDAFVLLSDRKIGKPQGPAAAARTGGQGRQAVLFVAEDVEGEALATLIVNQIRAVLRSCAVQAPGFGDRRKEMCRNGSAHRRSGDRRGAWPQLEDIQLLQLGRAQRIVVDKDHTTIIGGAGDKQAIAARIAQIRKQIRHGHERLRQGEARRAPRQAGRRVAVIRVGAPSEAEMKSKKERSMTPSPPPRRRSPKVLCRAAELALLRATEAVAREEAKAEGDEKTGLQNSAARARGAGPPDCRELGGGRRRGGEPHADQRRQPRLRRRAQGVRRSGAGRHYDPTKVVRIALENAVSVASVLLLTEATMTEIPKKEKPAGMPMPEM